MLVTGAPARGRTRWTVAAAAVALVCGLATGTTVPAAAGVEDSGGGVQLEVEAAAQMSQATFEKRILRQINKRRAAREMRRVRKVSPCLDDFAQDWATYLATTGLFVHRDQQVIIAACELTWAGETLARGSGLTPRETVKAWMKSPTHKAVIMKKRANRAGIGIDQDIEDRTIVVLNFGDIN
jgi:uncharacterized protein YkwD